MRASVVNAGKEETADIVLEIIEFVLVHHKDSNVASFIGTDFIVSFLEYPMQMNSKLRIRDKMGKETLRGYEICERGYGENFKP